MSYYINDRFWSKVKLGMEDECWPWMGARTPDGYGRLRTAGQGSDVIYAHRFSYGLVYGKPPGDLEVMHRCDNPSCVNPDHLKLGTHAENMADRNAKGRTSKGANHPVRRKLTPDQVLELRDRYAKGGISQRAIAAEYGVVSSVAHKIITRQTYKSI